jgi:hypothetical protein
MQTSKPVNIAGYILAASTRRLIENRQLVIQIEVFQSRDTDLPPILANAVQIQAFNKGGGELECKVRHNGRMSGSGRAGDVTRTATFDVIAARSETVHKIKLHFRDTDRTILFEDDVHKG